MYTALCLLVQCTLTHYTHTHISLLRTHTSFHTSTYSREVSSALDVVESLVETGQLKDQRRVWRVGEE